MLPDNALRLVLGVSVEPLAVRASDDEVVDHPAAAALNLLGLYAKRIHVLLRGLFELLGCCAFRPRSRGARISGAATRLHFRGAGFGLPDQFPL